MLVSSREEGQTGTVPAWFVIHDPGVVYLFSEARSVRVRRWRSDPWVRLIAPSSHVSAQGTATFVEEGPELDEVAPSVVETWGMWGATTEEGLRRLLRDRRYVLVRVSG